MRDYAKQHPKPLTTEIDGDFILGSEALSGQQKVLTAQRKTYTENTEPPIQSWMDKHVTLIEFKHNETYYFFNAFSYNQDDSLIIEKYLILGIY